MRNAVALLVLLGALAFGRPALAESPAHYCLRVRTDDATRHIPPALAGRVNALFGFHMPAQAAVATTVFRCADGRVMVCNAGANLPCGKANTSRANAGASAWCREHPGAEVIPMAATGHDSIYAWRCAGAEAEIARQTEHMDQRGFVARYWRPLE